MARTWMRQPVANLESGTMEIKTMIKVLVRSPSKRGRLYPRYDKEAGILAVESRDPRPWPYGVNIDGSLVFDADGDGLLANFDLHVRADLWQRTSARILVWPPDVKTGDIVFPEETLRTK